jgi:predicted TIM-barrel fold metal-dependent hydrolase
MDRRTFLATSTAATTLALVADNSATENKPPIIDTHMHVWAKAGDKYPYPHPYIPDFKAPPHEGTLEMLMADMDAQGCTHSVLVQVIYHGWDNAYVAECVRRYPNRLKAHGLIDPTDPKVADKLEYWMKEQGLAGMRFSPLYYADGKHGGDAWLTSDAHHRLWKKGTELGAIFNFFITPPQLVMLETMVKTHRDMRIIIDHLSQIDFKAPNAESHLRLLLAMARHPNIWVKVSELSSVSKSGEYPFSDAYPHVKRVYEAFGPDRLLFGTGYPGAARAFYKRPTLDKEIRLFDEMPFFTADDRRKILGGNAMRLWGFKPLS